MSDAAEIVDACPECDAAHIQPRATKTPMWLCRDCRAEFDEPATRKPRQYGETHPDVMYGQGTYKELKLALWRTLDAGSRYADAKTVAKYTDELTAKEIGPLLNNWGVDDGLVSVWSDHSNGTRFCIEIDGGIDDA